MRLLIWQWGRRGAGPRFAMELAAALGGVRGVTPILSLSRQAEIMEAGITQCDLPVDTYRSAIGWGGRLLSAPFWLQNLTRQLRALKLDAAVCAMPGPLDLVMGAALHRLGVPFAVIVHDADLHPGDTLRLQALFQRRLLHHAGALVALSNHVGQRLEEQGILGDRPLLSAGLSSFAFGPLPPPPGSHNGKLRLLSFGRLLPYKGLDLLLGALQCLGSEGLEVRVVGLGPESSVLAGLRKLPGVTVENRWVPETEMGDLLAWSDAVVLSHREASQSGIAAAAIAARRWIVATKVGGLVEQLEHEPLARLCVPAAEHLAQAIGSLLTDPLPQVSPRPDGFQHAAINLLHQIGMAFDVSNGLA